MEPALTWPTEQELRERLAAMIGPDGRGVAPFAVAVQEVTFRLADLKFADPEKFVDGGGARLNGARFTPLLGQRTLYVGGDRLTTYAEFEANYTAFDVPAAFRPHQLAGVGVSLELVLDACNPATLAALGLTPEHLGADWRPRPDVEELAPVQVLGRLVFEAGFEGLRFPSRRRPGGVNFALFPENYRPGSSVSVLNAST